MNNSLTTCLWCHHASTINWVHGHGQCSVCGINVDECCRGESCVPHFFYEDGIENSNSTTEGIDIKNE